MERLKQILAEIAPRNDRDLHEACRSLLDCFAIRYVTISPANLPVDAFLTERFRRSNQELVNKIREICVVGIATQDTFAQAHPQVMTVEQMDEELKNDHYQEMAFFSVDITASVTRTEVAALTRAFNRRMVNRPVVLFIRHDQQLTLSTCERTAYVQKGHQGEKAGKVTMLRNIDCTNPHRGHLEILSRLELGKCNSFDELYATWMEAFNSELLTQNFYNDLFDWYQWAVNPEAKVSFPNDPTVQEDDREDIDTKVIRLITRLMFVWFIKQKGLVPSEIFKERYVASILKDFDSQSTTSGAYYNAIIQNLFFGTLNRPIIEDGEVRGFAESNEQDCKNLYRYEELFSISKQEVIDMFATVPFLNCGLFECQDKNATFDGVERRFYNDGFSRNAAKFKDGTYKYRAVVPNILFFEPTRGLLSIFNKYVFTIEENTPQDVQVALDPELLGKVFENLLGAYNPETRETARNQSGSFYTPREIVQYMVNESLVAHLKRTVGEELEPQYRQLMDFSEMHVELSEKQKHDILHSLFTCKILDPACGSGAFPMGMLQQMVHILRQVDPDNTQWKDVLLNMAVDESRRAFGIDNEEERQKKLLEIERTFDENLKSPDYTRKLYIIESCIYGVDIQPIAMLITRLRFFISLICEQTDIRRDDPEHNFGIKTLPNLESKFVAANTLIDADIHKYNEDWTANPVLMQLKNELLAIRRRHFYTRKRNEKKRLRKQDNVMREKIHQCITKLVGEPDEGRIALFWDIKAKAEAELTQYLEENWVEETQAVPASLFDENPQTQVVTVDKNKPKRLELQQRIKKCDEDIQREMNKTVPSGFEAAVLEVTKWNPYDQNSVSPFFDLEWMFGITDGFDIVIGNPPYLRIQGIRSVSSQYAEYLINNYKSATGSFDLYMCFVERSLKLIGECGFVNFIMPIKWSNSAAGKGLRKLFSESHSSSRIINFGAYQVFNASTYTALQWFKPKSDYLSYQELDRDLVSNQELSQYLSSLDSKDSSKITYDRLGEDPWILTSSTIQALLDKLAQQPRVLDDVFDNIFCGLQTSRDDTYFLHNCTVEDGIVRGFSKDLNKYIDIEEGLVHPLLKGDDVHRYDRISTHRYVVFPYHVENDSAILYTEDEIKKLFPKGYIYLKECEDILRGREHGRLMNDANWYKYIYPKSLALFCKEKLLSPYTSLGSNYAYDQNGDFYATTKIYGYIKKSDVKASYKALMAIMNTRIMWFFIKNTGYVLRGGYYTYATNYVSPFPIPSDEDILQVQNQLEHFVDQIIDAKSSENLELVQSLESRIDEIAYKLYGLNENDIKLIES